MDGTGHFDEQPNCRDILDVPLPFSQSLVIMCVCVLCTMRSHE